MARRLKRFRMPGAHIDSTLVVAYAVGVIAFAVSVAYATRGVISPYWLGTTIVALALYQLAIFWVMLQSWEIDRIMTVFVINILSLGIIMSAISYLLNISLPVDLPVLSIMVHLAGIEATSASPGAVGLSYATLAIQVGLLLMIVVSQIENMRYIDRAKKILRLDEVDLRADIALEKISGSLEDVPGTWLIAPLGLMVIAMLVVIGGAWLIS